MKSTELRIGNETSLGKITFIEEGRFGVESDLEVQFDNIANDINPIPITTERLLSFGFISDDARVYKIQISPHTEFRIVLHDGSNPSACALVHPNEKGNLVQGNTMLLSGNVIVPKCPDFIHELQNLYFALKGEELEVELITYPDNIALLIRGED